VLVLPLAGKASRWAALAQQGGNMKLGTFVDYDGRRKYIGKRILKNQNANTFRLLGNSFTVYMFKRDDGHIVTVAQNIFDRLTADQQNVQPTIESVGSAPAVVVESQVASPAESG